MLVSIFFVGIQNFSLKIARIGRIWLNPTRSSRIWLRSCQIWSKSRQIWLDFASLAGFFIQLQSGSSCSGFGEANLPLDSPVSILENINPLPTDWTLGSGQNRVAVGPFGWVVGLRSGLDNPNQFYELYVFQCIQPNNHLFINLMIYFKTVKI